MKRLGHRAIIAHDIGLIFEFLARITLVPFIVLIIYQEWEMIIPMGAVPFIFITSGLVISRVQKKSYTPSLSVALVAVALTWLAIAFVCAVPFVLALDLSWTDSIFEAMSGWTGTGFTMMTSLDTMLKIPDLLAVVYAVGRGYRHDCIRYRYALPLRSYADSTLPL